MRACGLGQPELVGPHLAAQNVWLREEQGLPGQVLLGEGRLSRQGVVFAQQAEEPRLADLLVPQAGSARLPQGDHPVQGPFPQPGEELDVRQGDQVGVQAGEPLAQPPQDLRRQGQAQHGVAAQGQGDDGGLVPLGKALDGCVGLGHDALGV